MFKRTLIVDDSSTARMVIRRCLEIGVPYNMEFFEAINGIEALAILKKEDVDLILTDINMPEMDGRQLLRRIKSSPRLNTIPVVVISSIANPGIESKLLSGGEVAVITKPMSPMVLAEAIESLDITEEGES